MATLVTLEELREGAQERADMENATFVSETRWNDWINKGASKFYDILTRTFEDYNLKQTQLSVASSSSVQVLPSDFYKLRALDEIISGSASVDPTTGLVVINGQGVTLLPYNLNERNSYTQPTGTRNLVMTYIPAMIPLVNDSDTIDSINGWEDYIELYAAIQARIKEEDDVTDLKAELNEVQDQITRSAPNRDAGMPPKMTDVHAVDPFFSAYTISRLRYSLGTSSIRFVEYYIYGNRY